MKNKSKAHTYLNQAVVHPVLFALYPVIALYAFNMGQSRMADAIRAFIFLPVLAGMVLALLKLIMKDWGRAGLMTSLIFLLFFSYGHLVNRLSSTRFGPFLEQFPWLIAAIYTVIFLVGGYIIGLKLRSAGGLTLALNGVGVVLMLLPLYSILSFSFINRAPSQPDFLPATREPDQVITPRANLPDIYYIIPDGYAREDVLAESI